jgi:hypothetical protein
MSNTDTDTNKAPKSDDVERTPEEIAARWSDDDPRAAHAERFGTTPDRPQRFYGSIGNP